MVLKTAKAKARALIKDTRVEPYFWWCWKQSRGIRIPIDNVRNQIFDRQGFEIMAQLFAADSVGIDIGCHAGEYLRMMLKLAPRGKHYAFEPIPQMAAALQRNFPTAEVFQMALSDKEGTTEFFYFADHPALSSLARREEISDAQPERIEVRVAPLDTVVPPGVAVRFIKIDVEGAEGPVLTGARELIVKHRPYILFEHGRAASAHFGWSSEDLYDYLIGPCSCRVSQVGDWLQGRRPLTRQEFGSASGWYFLAHP